MQSFTSGGGVASFDFSDSRTLWVVGTDAVVRRHEVLATHAFSGHTAAVQDIVLSNDGSFALSVAADFTVRRWDVEAGGGRVLVSLNSSSHGLGLDEGAGRVAVTDHWGAATMLFDLETGARLADAPSSVAKPVVGPGGALFGAGVEGVWRDLRGTSSVVADDVGECLNLAATTAWVAAVCRDDDLRLHLWADDEHTSTPLSGGTRGASLHAWPDAQHLYFVGAQEQLVRRSDSGGLEHLASPRLQRELEPFFFPPVASSPAHDLIIGRSDGIHSMWDTTDETVPLVESNSRSLAISGDGLRIAYATDRYQVIVRDRALSKTHPALADVLEAAAAVGGER